MHAARKMVNDKRGFDALNVNELRVAVSSFCLRRRHWCVCRLLLSEYRRRKFKLDLEIVVVSQFDHFVAFADSGFTATDVVYFCFHRAIAAQEIVETCRMPRLNSLEPAFRSGH